MKTATSVYIHLYGYFLVTLLNNNIGKHDYIIPLPAKMLTDVSYTAVL